MLPFVNFSFYSFQCHHLIIRLFLFQIIVIMYWGIPKNPLYLIPLFYFADLLLKCICSWTSFSRIWTNWTRINIIRRNRTQINRPQINRTRINKTRINRTQIHITRVSRSRTNRTWINRTRIKWRNHLVIVVLKFIYSGKLEVKLSICSTSTKRGSTLLHVYISYVCVFFVTLSVKKVDDIWV